MIHRCAKVAAFVCSLIAAGGSAVALTLKATFQSVPGEPRQGPVEVSVGKRAHLILQGGDSGTLVATEGPRRRLNLAELMIPSNRLVAAEDGQLWFSGLALNSRCALFGLSNEAKPIRVWLDEECSAAELFELDDGIITWVQRQNRTHYVNIRTGPGPGTTIDLPGADLLVTSVAGRGQDFFVAMQSPTGSSVELLRYVDQVLRSRVVLEGAGAAIATSKHRLYLSLTRGKRRYLIALNRELGRLWETHIVDNVGIGSRANLLVEDDRIYYVSGNDNRLIVSVFDSAGNGLDQIQDDQYRYPVPINGYAVSLRQGALKVVGLVPAVQKASSDASQSGVVTFELKER